MLGRSYIGRNDGDRKVAAENARGCVLPMRKAWKLRGKRAEPRILFGWLVERRLLAPR